MQPASFQDVTPGPKSSYGTTSMPPDPGRYRSQVAWWHHYRDAIEEQGAKVGVRNPVALLVGTCALVLLVLIASLKPAATLKTALELDTDGFIDPSMSLDGSELHLQQLPCWTGSCDNYLFEDAAQLLDDATCDDLADGFGCNECKREDDMPDPLVPYASEGRVVLCPRSPVGIQIGDYVAVPAKEYPQALGMLHLPTVRDCTSYYLLQARPPCPRPRPPPPPPARTCALAPPPLSPRGGLHPLLLAGR